MSPRAVTCLSLLLAVAAGCSGDTAGSGSSSGSASAASTSSTEGRSSAGASSDASGTSGGATGRSGTSSGSTGGTRVGLTTGTTSAGATTGRTTGGGSSSGADGGLAVNFPTIIAGAGEVMATPQVVTVTFTDDPNASENQAFGAWVPTSTWFSTVGADYGVGPGSAVAAPLPFTAKSSLGDGGAVNLLDDPSPLVTFLQARIADGTLPAPIPDGGLYGQTLYLVYYPPSTAVIGSTNGAGGAHGCATASSTPPFFTSANPGFSYAWFQFNASLPQDQIVASHELIEAATDPCGNWGYRAQDYLDGWMYVPNEVADLCAGMHVQDSSSGDYVARVWSTTAAGQRHDPCIPEPARPYTNVSPSPDAIQTVPAGQSTAITLTGWSDVPTSPWPIAAATGTPSGAGCTFDPKPKLSATQVGDGTSVTLTLSVPAGTPSSCVGLAYVSSGTKGLAYGAPPFWPFAIRSQ